MNEFMRCGQADEYVEVCADWQSEYYGRVAWQFRSCVGEDYVHMKQALIEAFDITEEDLK